MTRLTACKKIRYNYHAKLALKVPKEQKAALFHFLRTHSSLNTLSEINSGFDFFAETVHHDIKGYLALIEELKEHFNLLQLQEYQVIEEIEKEKFLQ